MSKELEKVNEIHNKVIYYADGTAVIESGYFNLLITYAKESLQRLESIDNSNPNEALECLEKVKGYRTGGINSVEVYLEETKEYISIEQSLLKQQEQDKVIEILKKKRVDLSYLRCCFEDNQSVHRYNEYIRNKTMDYDHEEELTEEEYDLLKRWLG